MEDTPRVIERPVLEIIKGQIPEALPLEDKPFTEVNDKAELIVKKAQARANSIIEEAQQKAAALVNEAKKEAEQLKIAGHDEGYQEGRLQGKNEGQKQGQEIGKQEFHDKIQTGTSRARSADTTLQPGPIPCTSPIGINKTRFSLKPTTSALMGIFLSAERG